MGTQITLQDFIRGLALGQCHWLTDVIIILISSFINSHGSVFPVLLRSTTITDVGREEGDLNTSPPAPPSRTQSWRVNSDRIINNINITVNLIYFEIFIKIYHDDTYNIV